MTKQSQAVGDRLPCGMVSLKMFQIPHSKALIIAYLDMRGGLKKYTFNVSDISNQTDIGTTVVRQYLKELVGEGVLKRRGKSFYQLNRHKMEESYYRQVSESDSHVSESDTHLSETDTNVSESDTEVSESDSIHSSNLHSSKLDSKRLDSSKLHSTANLAAQASESTSSFSSPAPTASKTLSVSGTPPEPLETLASALSGDSGAIVTLAPKTSAFGAKKEADSVGQPTATKSGALPSPGPTEQYTAEHYRQLLRDQHRNMKLYGSPFGPR